MMIRLKEGMLNHLTPKLVTEEFNLSDSEQEDG